jgi:hypothetical protein
MDTNTRADGLPITEAVRTISYLGGKYGVDFAPAPDARLRGRGKPDGIKECERAFALHGFAVLGAVDEIIVDPKDCPEDATPEQRELIAERLSHAAGREARTRQAEECTASGCDCNNCEDRAERDAADDEYRWCLQQTLPFLRARLAAS